MSQKRKSRSVISIPIFDQNEEVKNFKENIETKDFNFNKFETRRISPKHRGNEARSYKELVTVQESNSPTNSYSSDLDGILDLSTKLSGLSSSSSLSWSEDYELEITKKVQLELEKLDKAFQGLGDIPPPHDKDEIEEWKYFFPHLCILDEKTPTNSTENSEASSDSDDDTPTHTDINPQSSLITNAISRTKHFLTSKGRTEEQAQNFLNGNTLPRKPRSLEIEKYLRISSIKSPNPIKRKQRSQPTLIRQPSKELIGDASPEYTSLPFITATPLKTQIRKPPKKNSKLITLPPIVNTTNSFRSISATPRQTSSKSMFGNLNFGKDSSARADHMRLRNDLMKLFDFIPISNR